MSKTFKKFVSKVNLINEAARMLLNGTDFEELPRIFAYKVPIGRSDKCGEDVFRQLWDNFPQDFANYVKSKDKRGSGLPEERLNEMRHGLVRLVKSKSYKEQVLNF
jgi:hypothetical protein